ncbi:hypothetical protein V6N13_122400 [Hibiscus sabdariffa]|uniref:Uncharacterized protein n=1 Tax=Hibiscus sabdariffa TaxID=183260 RepID=A0ABR2Q7Y0_9ROSI
MESINGRIPHSRAYVSEVYDSSVYSRINVRSVAEKYLNSRQLQHEKFFDDDVPSANGATDSLDPMMLKGTLSFSSVAASLRGTNELLE